MKKAEAKKLLDTYFKDRLESIGFKKSKYGFVRKERDYFVAFGYSLVDLDNSFSSQFGIHCGFESIDKVYGFSVGRNVNQINLYSISQAGLYDERKYPKLEYDLYTESDIQHMVSEVAEYLERKALPFFANLSTIERLEKFRNENPTPQQAKSGLILAKLVGNPNYENLKGQYRLLLKDWPESDKQELEKIIAFLDQHTTEELLQIAQSQA